MQQLPAFMQNIQKQSYATPTVFGGLSKTEEKIKSIATQQPEPVNTKRTTQRFFDDVTKIKQNEGYDDEKAILEAAKYYTGKGYEVEGVNFDDILQEEVQPVEDIQWLDAWVKAWEAISWFWEWLKFEAQEDDRGITSVAKFFGNLPWDTLQLAWDLVSVVSNPVWTVQSVDDFAGSMVETGLNKVFWQDTYTSDERRFIAESVWTELKKISEDPSILKDMAVENPADILFSITWGLWAAKNAAKTKGMTGLASKLEAAEALTNPIKLQAEAVKWAGKAVWATVKGVWEWGLTITWVATGLSPDTIKTIFKNPDIVKSGITREWVANKVVWAIDDRITEVWELGKGYDTVKKGNIVTNSDEIANVRSTVLDNFDTKELTKKDQSALADAEFYISKYDWELTDSNILALRQQLDSIKYDESGNIRKLSKNGNAIVTQLRSKVDEIAKDRIEGLRELDAQYAEEIGELSKVRKMIFDRNWDLKDGYIWQIANLLGKNKEMKLERIKKLVPEIETEINAVKALENVEFAKGRQIGAYMQGWGMVWVATGVINPATAVIWLMLSSPTIVSNMVRALWYSARTVWSITEKIKNGIKLTASESAIVWKAIQEQMINKAWNLADNIADKTGARAKFIDDGGKSLDDFGEIPQELNKLKNKVDEFNSPEKAYDFFRTAKTQELFWEDASVLSQKFIDFIDPLDEKWPKRAFFDFYDIVKKQSWKLDDFKEVGTTESALIKEVKENPSYHWTNVEFKEFDPKKINTVESSWDYIWEWFYFTSNQWTAKRYAKQAVDSKWGEEVIKKVYLDMKNPLIIKSKDDIKRLDDMFWGNEERIELLIENPNAIKNKLQSLWYDGLIDDLYWQRAVFDVTQISNRPIIK